MPTSHKVLGQTFPAVASPATLYTVPAATQTVCSTLSICNTGAATTYRVSVRPAGAAQDDKHYLAYNPPINANDTVLLTLGITLAASDVVTVYSANGAVAFSLFGAEIT